MRITFVHKTANFSGGNRVVATYAERLAARGHRVCVVSAKDPRPRPLRVALNRVKGRTFPVGDGRSWLDELSVEHRVLPSARPVHADDLPDADVIVATWWETAEWIAALPPEKGAKAYFLQGVEWTIDDMPAARVRQTWRLPLHKIVIAEFMADIARREFGDSDVSLVPNAIDTELFFAPPRERSAQPTVGLMEVGPLAIKGGDITRAALALAKERLPELRGVCFGRAQPPPERALPAWVDMHVSPTPEALRRLYARCDVFVHASRAEGFGLPLLEAMACRTPVAATPAGAAPELLPRGGGTLVPHDDPRALADAIVAIATLSPEAWRARSDAAHARATGYTLDDATQRMEAALERAVTKSARSEYVRASARGDAGPAPALTERLRALRDATTTTGSLGSAPLVLSGLWSEAIIAASARQVTDASPAAATGTARDTAGERWLAPDQLPAELHALWDALTHPAALAALEDLTGTSRLLLDPHAREQGMLLVRPARPPRRTFTLRFQDPPLERRFTLILPLAGHTIALSDTRTGERAQVSLRAGDALLAPAGPTRVVDSAGLVALVLPLYQAGPIPDGLPSLDEHFAPPDGAAPLALLRHALGAHVHALRVRSKRELARLRERWLGLH